MAKVNKVYPSFYNGVTEQPPELAMDTQCKAMSNCIPSLINGLKKRPAVTFRKSATAFTEDTHIFHTYDRGEGSEQYIFMATGNYNNPIAIYNKAGEPMNVTLESGEETAIKDYLANGRLKGLTVQDRTWLINKDINVEVDTSVSTALDHDYTRTAYYWIKRGSGDRYNPYNYAVYINGTKFACNPNKPSGDVKDPPTGFEDSDYAANYLAGLINGATLSLYKAEGSFKSGLLGTIVEEGVFLGKNLTNVSAPILVVVAGSCNPTVFSWNYNASTGIYSYTILNQSSDAGTITIEVTANNPENMICEVKGSILKMYKKNGSDFTFSSWDSWGDQASEGWKGAVNKLTDLPRDFPWKYTYVAIDGDNNDSFTKYYVYWNGSTWEETRDPEEVRGFLTNMPIACERTSLVDGVATFNIKLLNWSTPRVGNLDNNPDPSFVGYPITDLFFYKNRFGIASTDSIVMSETANYENFYVKTAVEIMDTDPIDVAIAGNQASKIHYAKPFNNSLYVFTKYTQYEVNHEGFLSPETVSIETATNYPMAIDVEPQVMNNSLYFVSNTGNKQQLREYIKTEKLTVEGVDLNITTPNYLTEPITNIVVNGVLGFVLCTTATNKVYVYNFKEDGTQRVQSAWSEWNLLEGLTTTENSFEYFLLDSTLLVICKTATHYLYHTLDLDDVTTTGKVDVTRSGVELPYKASVRLPDFYPHLSKIGTPKDKMLLKKVSIEGSGSFNASVYRKDYDRTFEKSNSLGLKDLDLHIASKVGNVEIDIYDDSSNDFNITSIVMEGMYSPTSKEVR